MTSSSNCFFLVLMVVLLQFSASALASTKYINTICNKKYVEHVTFCRQTLTAYPPAVAATSLFSLVKTVIGGLGVSYAEKTTGFVAEVAKHGHTHTLKKQFKLCKENYATILMELRGSISELKDHPEDANYAVMICYDNIRIVKELVGKNKDTASKKLMKMTLMMEKIIALAVAATKAVGG